MLKYMNVHVDLVKNNPQQLLLYLIEQHYKDSYQHISNHLKQLYEHFVLPKQNENQQPVCKKNRKDLIFSVNELIEI